MDWIVDDLGEVRYLGNLERPEGLLQSWPIFGSVPSQRLIPRSQWNELVPDEAANQHPLALLDNVHDQDGIGMCNCSATVAGMECVRAAQGLPHVPLSGGDLYRRISGGVDQGSFLEDGIRESMARGVLPVADCPYLNWRTIYGKQEVRDRYKVAEAYLCPTFDHCYSSSLQGFFLISGIMWYGNYTPDRQGWLPQSGSGRPGGHAVMGYKPTRRGNRYGIWHKNSWSRRWGLNGTCVFNESNYGRQIGGWWAVRVVTDEGGNVPAPRA